MKSRTFHSVIFITLSLVYPCMALTLTPVDSFQSPVLNPALDLDYDPISNTLWGCDNSNSLDTTNLCIYNFDLSGNLLSSWPTGRGYNLRSVAVDSSNNRIFYYTSISRELTESTLDGKVIRRTVLPWGSQSSVHNIAYDSQAEKLILTWHEFSGKTGFYSFSPETQQLFNFQEFSFPYSHYGFDLDQNFYYVQDYDATVQIIDRQTLQLQGHYELASTSTSYASGLAIGQGNILYQINGDGLVNVYEIPEPATLALLALGGLILRKRK